MPVCVLSCLVVSLSANPEISLYGLKYGKSCISPGGETGRRKGLKIPFGYHFRFPKASCFKVFNHN